MNFNVGDQVVVLYPATVQGHPSCFRKQVRGEVVGFLDGTVDVHVSAEEMGDGKPHGLAQYVDPECLRHWTIDLERARELLAQAVETKGRDFVYKERGASWGCDYYPVTSVPEGDPRRETGCLVGVALNLHGIDVSQLAGSVDSLHTQEEVAMSEDAAAYFLAAQGPQDSGSTWGEAYDQAEERLANGTLHEADDE